MRRLVFLVGLIYSCVFLLSLVRLLPIPMQAHALVIQKWYPMMLVGMLVCCFGPVRRVDGGYSFEVWMTGVVLLTVSLVLWLLGRAM